MVPLLEMSHSFTLDEVTAEHQSRSDPPPLPVLINGIETAASTTARVRCYDNYEFDDMALSRLAIDVLLTVSLRERLKTRFSHVPGFDELPGQIIFMMTLEVCNVSANMDIAGAKTSFKALSLATYPGENVSAFATEALKLINIMMGEYAMDLKNGSSILRKVENMQSTHFNFRIHNHLNNVLGMERKYEMKDPALMKGDPLYIKYGPLGYCGILQEEYGILYAEKKWPALEPTIPRPEGHLSGNLLPIECPETPATPAPAPARSNVRECFECGSPDHIKSNCPNRTSTNRGARGGSAGGGGTN